LSVTLLFFDPLGDRIASVLTSDSATLYIKASQGLHSTCALLPFGRSTMLDAHFDVVGVCFDRSIFSVFLAGTLLDAHFDLVCACHAVFSLILEHSQSVR